MEIFQIRIFTVLKLGKSFSKKSHVIHEIHKVGKIVKFCAQRAAKIWPGDSVWELLRASYQEFGGKKAMITQKKIRKDDCIR